MEKRISYSHFQQVKSVAKTIDPIIRQKARIQAQIDGLDAEFITKGEEALAKLKQKLQDDMAKKKNTLEAELRAKDEEIAVFEAGIVNNIGFHVTDLVKKVIEPTGKTDPKTNKPITVTKYVDTDIVSYDSQKREYVITVPDVEAAGADYDKDAEQFQAEGNHADEPTENAGDGQPIPEVADEPTNGSEKMPWEND